MGKAIFSVTYRIIPEKREQYIELMKKIKEKVEKELGQNYSVYEDTSEPNMMSEVYYLNDESNIELVKKFQESDSDNLLDQIEEYVLELSQVAIRTFKETV